MKFLKQALVLMLVAGLALTACHKDHNVAVSSTQLTVSDTGKTISFTTGQTFAVTLDNPGDGGYSFNAWQYDASVLKLDSHVHTAPANPNVTGDFGIDTWQFTALKSGTTTLQITASRTPQYTVTMFNTTIAIK
jgi:predicted secreted protein